ncbi:MAG: hypothetical protein HDR12_04735 [Lachnospiraceae bacterium]|nr:hypothetical protein [Lachnospiraceae bacterium]
MREKKILSLLIIIINVIGVICLIYFAIPFLTHDTAIANPNAMLPAEAWDRAGMTLTFGFMPLLAANALSFLFVRIKRKCVKFLFFIPSVTCFIIVVSYWITSLG